MPSVPRLRFIYCIEAYSSNNLPVIKRDYGAAGVIDQHHPLFSVLPLDE